VLDVVDHALESAAKEGTKTSERVDENFEAAIKTLYEYHVEYHPEHPASNIRDRMAGAREKDKSSLTILNRLKGRFPVRGEVCAFALSHSDTYFQPVDPEPTRIVEFLLHKTLPDRRPTIVKSKPRLSEFTHST
jgi:hypothetical protein